MARYGEGDKRRMVEERPDGANVHNWQWAERDCLEWSRFRLSSLLQNLPILSGEGGVTVKTKSLEKLEGEAYVNIRKGKIIPWYELSLSLSWEGEVLPISGGGDVAVVKVAGSVEVPYLAYDNANVDPEVRITVKDLDGPVGARIRVAFMAKGKPVVLEKVKEYVRAMAQGGPAMDDLEVKESKAEEGEKAIGGGTMSGGDEDATLPRDARIVKALLKSMGVESYEPCVIHQLLELWYRYVVDVLTDAQVYSDHASKSSIDVDDIKLAIQTRVNSSFSQPPPREVLMELARNRNRVPLPKSIVGAGIPLPPEQETLINPNYQLLIPKRQAPQVAEMEEEEEMVPADNRNPVSSPRANANLVQERQQQQRVSFQMTAGKRAR